jgi:DNA mismatch repair protein MutS2
MPENVLQDAQQMLSGDQLRLEDMLTRLEADQRKIASHASKMADAASELEAKKEALRKELEALRKQRREMLLEAHRQADALVENTRREMENLVRQIRENAKNGHASPDLEAEKCARQAIEERRRKLSRGLRMHESKPREPLSHDELSPGMRVWVEKLQADGTVERLFGGNKVSVNVNGLSFTMNFGDISRAHGTITKKTDEPVVKVMLPVSRGATPSELNLVGMRVEDALQRLEEYLDRSGLARLSQVTIVHGFGSGRLRNAIHQFLLTSPLVQDFKLTKDNGGSTEVTLKM